MKLQKLVFITACCFAPVYMSAQMVDITWSYTENMEVDYGIIGKINSSNTWNAGGVSLNLLPPGQQGEMKFKVSTLGKNYMIGLVSSSVPATFSNFEYALEVRTNNNIFLHSGTTLIGSYGIVKVGDEVGLQVRDAEVFVVINGQLVSPAHVLRPIGFLVSVGIKTPGTVIERPQCTFDNQFAISWASSQGVNIENNGSLLKTAPTGWGNAVAFSENVLPFGTSGYVTYVYEGETGQRVFGLQADTADLSSNFDYYARLQNSTVYYYRHNTLVASTGGLVNGTKIIVERNQNEIHYKINNNIVQKISVSPLENLSVVAAIYNTGIPIKPLAATFIPDKYVWGTTIRLVNADDPEHIPVTRTIGPSYLEILYKELYVDNGPLNIQIFDNQFNDVTASVSYLPSAVHFGENSIRVNINVLPVGYQYHLVVRDGMDRKWQMNFYKKQ